MAKYHLSKDGKARICSASGACPLGELPHAELDGSMAPTDWAEEELRKQYGTGTVGFSKKLAKNKTVEGYDRAKEAVAQMDKELNQGWREGESLFSEKMLKLHVAYYTVKAEEEELSGAVVQATNPFSADRRKRGLAGGIEWANRALDAQLQAQAFSRALIIRKDLHTMGAEARAIAVETMKELVNASEYEGEVNTELDDTPADRHKAAVLTLASELYAADPEAQRQEGEDALAGKSDLYEDLETALWLKYHRLPFKEKKAFFYTAKDSVNVVLSHPDEDSEERARRLHRASIKRGLARPDQTYLQLPLKERRHYNKLIAWADNSIKRG